MNLNLEVNVSVDVCRSSRLNNEADLIDRSKLLSLIRCQICASSFLSSSLSSTILIVRRFGYFDRSKPSRLISVL